MVTALPPRRLAAVRWRGSSPAGGSLSLGVLIVSLIVAAVLGDTVNYWVGHFLGHRLLASKRRIIKPEHLAYTHEFFEKYGGKTIILARFVPIVRTLAPFVAGLGAMSYGRFMSYNVIGGSAWVLLCTLAGYALYRQLRSCRTTSVVVELLIIVLSLLPAIWELWKARSRAGRGAGISAPAPALTTLHMGWSRGRLGKRVQMCHPMVARPRRVRRVRSGSTPEPRAGLAGKSPFPFLFRRKHRVAPAPGPVAGGTSAPEGLRTLEQLL